MATVTAARPGRHRLPRVPARTRLISAARRAYPTLADFSTDFGWRAARWMLPGTIVLVAITTKGTG